MLSGMFAFLDIITANRLLRLSSSNFPCIFVQVEICNRGKASFYRKVRLQARQFVAKPESQAR